MATIPRPPINLPPPTMGGSEWNDWEPPTDGWHTLVCDVVYDDETGQAKTRPKSYKGVVDPDKHQIRVRYTIQGGPQNGKSWPEWLTWSLADLAPMRWMVNAIRKGKPLDPKVEFKIEHYVNKPFDAMILVNEVPARDDPSHMLYFPKIKKCKPVGAASPPDDDDEEEGDAPAPTRNGSKAPNPFAEEIDF